MLEYNITKNIFEVADPITLATYTSYPNLVNSFDKQALCKIR